MQIETLRVADFRLVRDARLELAAGANLFVGENAQGKTTLLEAVALLATGRSFRTHRDRELLPHSPADGYTFTMAECRFLSRHGRSAARVVLSGETRSHFIDGQPLRRLADLWGLLNVVVFDPADLQLVQGAPAMRRALLDSLLAMSSRADLDTMQRYARALRQRNALLRSSDRPRDTELESYEDQMAVHGARLLQAREELAGELGKAAVEHLSQLTGGSESLVLTHECGWPKSAGRPSAEEIRAGGSVLAEKLRSLWRADRQADWERAQTRHGPHRADCGLLLNGREARLYASQGQSRSIALALKLAELDVIEARCGEAPVLLLDDVLGELDRRRTQHFVRLLARRGIQSLLTATDAAMLEEHLPIAARFDVAAGAVRRVR